MERTLTDRDTGPYGWHSSLGLPGDIESFGMLPTVIVRLYVSTGSSPSVELYLRTSSAEMYVA